jgi:hypothetical protein
MKKQSTSLLTQISTNQMEELTGTVNGNLNIYVNASKSRIFTAADLWNIHQHRDKRVIKRGLSF